MFKKIRRSLKVTFIYIVTGIVWVTITTILLNEHFGNDGERYLNNIYVLLFTIFILLSAFIVYRAMEHFENVAQKKFHEYSQLFESNPNPMWIYSLETLSFLTINDAAVKEYGYSKDEFLSMTIKDIRPIEDISKLEESLKKRPHRYYTSGVWRHVKKSGEMMWVEIFSSPVLWNGFTAELILAHNVTKRVQYENELKELNITLEERVKSRTKELNTANHELATLNEELTVTNEELLATNDQLIAAQDKILQQADALVRQSRNKLNRIVATIDDMVWSGSIIKGKLIFDFINQAAEIIYGFPVAAFYQDENLWFDCIMKDDYPIIENVRHQLEEKGYVHLSHRIIDHQKKIKYLSVRIWSHTSETGGMRVDGITQDITAHKLQEAEKAKLIDQLVNQNNNLLQFSFITSHNLRGPVATLQGLLSLIKKEHIVNKDLQILFQYVDQSVGKLDEVIRDLSQTLNVRSGYKLREKVEFPALIATIKESLSDEITSTQCEIKTDFKVPALYTNRHSLHSIFYHLISNAIKYRSTEVRPTVEISTEESGNQILIRVSDNGMGIDLQRFESKVFTLYQRFHTHVEGKGFGLFLVRTQVEALQGSIDVISKPGEGSTFTICFPLHSSDSLLRLPEKP